jgi:ribonuclease E
MDSSRVARQGPMRPAVPGSMTGEIARMLEIERQNREPVDASTGGNGSHGPAGSAEPAEKASEPSRGLLRRRRAVTRPAGPPSEESPAAESAAAPEATAGAEASRSAQQHQARETAPVNQPPPADAPSAAEVSRSAAKSRPATTRATSAAVSSQPGDADQASPDQGQHPARRRPSRSRAASARTAESAAADARGEQPDAPAATAAEKVQSRGADEDAKARVEDAAGPTENARGSGLTVPVTPVPFQPPLVIFQAPELTPAPAAVRPERQEAADGPAEDAAEGGADGAVGTASRRRRRGGRGRGKTSQAGPDGAEQATVGTAAEPAPDSAEARDDSEEAGTAAGTGRRRRRRRRTAAGGEDASAATSADDPPNTVVHVRPPRDKAGDVGDVRAIKGSTRLEAKRQRRREGRESGRRRPPIITESEFLARREAVDRTMVVRQRADRTQIAVLEDGVLVEHYVDKASHQSYVGNVYLGKVQNVLPSMEAAFVDIGKGRNAVLYAGEVNFDASGLEGDSKRIESALKSGQSILVQVTKDPIGHKGARLTSQVSLPGRYLVYVPGANMTGISRKLPDTERGRLKQILKQVMPENAGVIVRTAAEGASAEELSRDVARLAAQWEAIEKKARTASAPDLLYSEPDLTLRVVRDIFNEDFKNLIVAGDAEWDLVQEYVRYVAPHLADRLHRWDDAGDVFAANRIDEQIAKALERKVWLPSGGSLVIDPTEAMTVIDVNTGKFTGQGGNLEQTVTRNNLEAAEEIVRQLRLRDIGGIIVIDFIDMVLESNRELVLRRLLECLARDRTKHQVAEVTSLGLVQMTRKRVGSGLLEAFSVPCEHCNGRGVIVSLEPVDHSHARDGERAGGPVPRPPRPAPPAQPVDAGPVKAGQRDVNGAGHADVGGPVGQSAEAAQPNGEVAEPATEPAGSVAHGAEGATAGRRRSGRSRRSATQAKTAGAAGDGDGQPADG